MFRSRPSVSPDPFPFAETSQRRFMMGLFEETASTGSGETDVAAFARSLDHLEVNNTRIVQKAYGIPFHIGEAEALDSVCRHHGANVCVHSVERYMMPFWLASTATGGNFRADILQKDPAFMTQQQCLVWVEGPNYEFHYPFGEHHTFNQVSASYLHPLPVVEKCLVGTHVPSMLIPRLQLLEELEKMKDRPRVVPFTMSTTTALSILDSRLTRSLVLRHINQELVKFHGSFVRSSITLLSVYKESVSIRPIFLPMLRFTVTTGEVHTPIPSFVCGATGRVVGPAMHLTEHMRAGIMLFSGAVALVASMPIGGPGIATPIAIAVAVFSLRVWRSLSLARFLRQKAQQMMELKAAGMAYFSLDQQGYRWSPEAEEREEYEQREELRRRAQKKQMFEQQVKEEAARCKAKQGRHVDSRNRRRTDLVNVDPHGYYKLLGLSGQEFTATKKDITRAFREAAQKHHPDVASGSEGEDDARKKMQNIIHAYKILRDPKTKREYDSGKLTDCKSDCS
ncbi:putative chaperone protein DNAj [Trypanosoma vivax]|nr:putative chaperone protein DNAj [Trypanosoma vivax]